ncbi:MAG: hypothetical protein QNI84_16200 [Henriciella sp.]|nr:hypothetical protein [Henriciella sp.]
MRKHIFIRLKMLLAAARVSLYTRWNDVATRKFSLDERKFRTDTAEDVNLDEWMFDPVPAVRAQATALSGQMDRLSDKLAGLKAMLAMITDESAFPIDLTTKAPCAMMPTDTDLFEGEYLPVLTVQDTTIGGEGAFLFDDEPVTFNAEEERHAA